MQPEGFKGNAYAYSRKLGEYCYPVFSKKSSRQSAKKECESQENEMVQQIEDERYILDDWPLL